MRRDVPIFSYIMPTCWIIWDGGRYLISIHVLLNELQFLLKIKSTLPMICQIEMTLWFQEWTEGSLKIISVNYVWRNKKLKRQFSLCGYITFQFLFFELNLNIILLYQINNRKNVRFYLCTQSYWSEVDSNQNETFRNVVSQQVLLLVSPTQKLARTLTSGWISIFEATWLHSNIDKSNFVADQIVCFCSGDMKLENMFLSRLDCYIFFAKWRVKIIFSIKNILKQFMDSNHDLIMILHVSSYEHLNLTTWKMIKLKVCRKRIYSLKPCCANGDSQGVTNLTAWNITDVFLLLYQVFLLKI